MVKRRGLLGAVLAAGLVSVAGCGSGAPGMWAHDLRRAGAFEGAMRHLRHTRPGSMAGVVEVMLPSTVRVQMLDSRTAQHTETLTWRRGGIDVEAPDPDVLPAHSMPFELNYTWPLIADVQFRAQRETGTAGVAAPTIEHLSMWVNHDQLELEVRLRETDAVRLRHQGGHAFEVLS